MITTLNKMSRSEQALVAPDGPYTQGFREPSMSNYPTAAHEDREKLKAIAAQFAPRFSPKKIMEAARKNGLGPINKQLLASIRRELRTKLVRPKRQRRDFGKYPIVDVPDRGVPECPNCGENGGKVITPYWQDDGSVIRHRQCKGCGERFFAREKTLPCERQYETRRMKAINATEKQCTKCKKTLPVEMFSKKDAYYHLSRCRECLNRLRADAQLRQNLREYGLTIEEYERLLESQNGGCAICGGYSTHSHGEKRTPLVFDHCHETGKFRGLICNQCNRAIGMMGDSADRIEKVARYLREAEARNGK